MDEIEVPPYFLCPISLEIMKDPVTISSGITYDRENIEKWLFSGKNETCPVTKLPLDLTGESLTPNIILRRYIQSWCTLHASHGIERFPTPKPPVSKSQIVKLMNDVVLSSSSSSSLMKCLQRLRSIASESEANRRAMEAAGVADFLALILRNNNNNNKESNSNNKESDEALSILNSLKLSDQTLKSLLGQETLFIESLVSSMQRGTYESRASAIVVLRSTLEVADAMQITGLKLSFYQETVQILRDQISKKATKAALQTLILAVTQWGRNKIKAVESGATGVLIGLLVDSVDKRESEMTLTCLEQLCQCAEGRAELLGHPAGLAVVSKKILRVSHVASERGVKILYMVSRFSATTNDVVLEMLQLGVAAKLCLVTQVECGKKTKDRAKEILKLHAKAWRDSPCLPLNLASSYPSS